MVKLERKSRPLSKWGLGKGQGLQCLQADSQAVQHKWTVLSLQAPSS